MKKALFLLFFSAFVRQLSASENPMLFTKNIGQWDARIYYAADLTIGKILLERNQITFAISDFNPHEKAHNPNMSNDIHSHVFRLKFQGANTETLIPGGEQSAYRNYYIGNDSSKWRSNVPVYQKSTFKNLYAGIDLEVSGDEQGFTYEYIVHPNANVRQIQQVYEGIDEVHIENNEIHYNTNIGKISEQHILAYQIIGNTKRTVKCVVKKNGKNAVFFEFPNGYNRSVKLIIDPTVVFGTYTGSTADNWGYTATYDNNGSMYVGGLVSNLAGGGSYPTTTGAFQTTYSGGTGNGSGASGSGLGYACDISITKYTPNGTALVYSTYLGGNDNETPSSLIVDDQGNLIVYGVTFSANYPVSAGAYDNSYNGNGDIVVTKFNANGTALVGSTFIGGNGIDGVNYDPTEFTLGNLKRNYGDQNRGDVNIDNTGNIYVASCTKSTNFPITGGALQSAFAGTQDGCIFKLNNNCSSLIWSTYLGGSSDDACYGMSLQPTGDLYVCGGTMSNNFPTTTNVWHNNYQGGSYDGFITHISANGTSLLKSSYIGTSGNDQVYFVYADSGKVYFTGQTTGAYPVINAAYSNPNSGQFISCVNATLDTVRYSTVFGNGDGQPNISPTAFLVDTCENVYVAGWGTNQINIFQFSTNLQNMPITNDALKTSTDGNDFYSFVLASNATSVLYASYFGGNNETVSEHVDGGTNRFDKHGIIYEAICGGCGGNSLIPSTPGVWSTTNRSQNCNLFGLKMEFNLSPPEMQLSAAPRTTGCVPLTVNFTSQSTNATSVLWNFGDGSTSTQPSPTHTFTDTGHYSVMLIGFNSKSCFNTDTAYIDIFVRNDSLIANFISGIAVNCTTKTVNLAAPTNSTATKYFWDFGDGTTDSTISVSHSYDSAGIYNITLILEDTTRCQVRDTFSYPVLIKANTEANFILTNPCAGQLAHFSNASQENNPAGNSFNWFFGDGGNTSSQENPTHIYGTSGVYDVIFVITDTSSCNIHDTLHQNITVYAPPVAAYTTAGDTFKFTQPVVFENQSTNADIYLWNFGDGVTSEETSPTHVFDHTINWQRICLVASSSTMPCIDSICDSLFISFTPLLGVPNAFSPNGDGHNDVVRVEGKGIIDLDFRIFNRWGEEVYHSTNQADGWDGFFKGTKQEMEVYTYVAVAKMINTQVITLKGNITLLR